MGVVAPFLIGFAFAITTLHLCIGHNTQSYVLETIKKRYDSMNPYAVSRELSDDKQSL